MSARKIAKWKKRHTNWHQNPETYNKYASYKKNYIQNKKKAEKSNKCLLTTDSGATGKKTSPESLFIFANLVLLINYGLKIETAIFPRYHLSCIFHSNGILLERVAKSLLSKSTKKINSCRSIWRTLMILSRRRLRTLST